MAFWEDWPVSEDSGGRRNCSIDWFGRDDGWYDTVQGDLQTMGCSAPHGTALRRGRGEVVGDETHLFRCFHKLTVEWQSRRAAGFLADRLT